MGTIRILADGLRFPEGPAFDANGNLWCAEQEGEGLFCRYTNGRTKRIKTGGKPKALSCYRRDLWFCDAAQNTVQRLNIHTETIETIINQQSGQLLSTPNALAFDEEGNLIITCPGPAESAQGYVVAYVTDGIAEIIAEGLLQPTCLTFYPDSQTLLIVEAGQQRIWSGYWNSVGTSWETIRVWTTLTNSPVGETSPAMAVGPDGNLYVTVAGAGLIRVFSVDGVCLRDIELPGQHPSDCFFDPSGELGLIVTESQKGQLLSVSV